jgi:cytochrome c oxidase subunit II
VSHANMLAKAVVVPIAEFEKWYFGNEEAPLPTKAKKLLPEVGISNNAGISLLNRHMCLSCHSNDGSAMIGPSFKGLYGAKRTVMDPEGKQLELTADDAYLTKSIEDPNAETVKGYPPVMPQSDLSEAEVQQVIEFIKTLK